MVNRFLEVMSLALLVVLTIIATFQVLNYQLLRQMQAELKENRNNPPIAAAQAPPSHHAAPVPLAQAPPPAPLIPLSAADPVAANAPPTEVPAQPPAPTTPPQRTPAPVVEVQPEPLPMPQPEVAAASVAETPPESAIDPAWEEFGPTVQRVIDDLFGGNLDAVVSRLTPDAKATLTPDILRSAVNRTVSRAGKPASAAEGRPGEVILAERDVRIFRYLLPTAGGETLTVSVSLTAEKRVAGLFVR